jgi:hypothetical protein
VSGREEATELKLFNRKSEVERLLEAGRESVTGGWTKGKILKTGLIAGGLAGLAAGSAGISSVRRRLEGARGS